MTDEPLERVTRELANPVVAVGFGAPVLVDDPPDLEPLPELLLLLLEEDEAPPPLALFLEKL